MKIVLFGYDCIYEYKLSVITSDTFSSVKNIDKLTKLVDINMTNKGYIMFTKDNTIINRGKESNTFILKKNEFYKVIVNNKEYLILVQDIKDDTFNNYIFNVGKLTLSTRPDTSITYNTEFLIDREITIKNRLSYIEIINEYNVPIYINNILYKDSNIRIHNGDRINIYGLIIYIFNNLLVINNIDNKVTINRDISPYKCAKDNYLDIECIDSTTNQEEFTPKANNNNNRKTKEIIFKDIKESIRLNRIPLKIAIIPCIISGIIAIYFLIDVLIRLTTAIDSNYTTLALSWKSIVPSAALLAISILIPYLIYFYNRSLTHDEKNYVKEKRKEQLKQIELDLKEEQIKEREYLYNNSLNTISCIRKITTKDEELWNKNLLDNEFLEVRLGIGNKTTNTNIIKEVKLTKEEENVINRYKKLKDVPYTYSLANKVINIIGNSNRRYNFLNNILIQIMASYYYDDVKLIILTSEDKKDNLEYLKYNKYIYNNSIRYYATNIEEAKYIDSLLLDELRYRMENKNSKTIFKPYYLIITDDYDLFKNINIIKENLIPDNGYSLIVLSEYPNNNIPSKHIISLEGKSSKVDNDLFKEEIEYNINMLEISRKISNINNSYYEIDSKTPDSFGFLSLEKVGNIKQLNIKDRWDRNKNTNSIIAPIGLGENYNVVSLDITKDKHEIILGDNKSTRTELMISYLLSLAVNYSPNEVSFVLIDTNNGKLISALNNRLPHIVGIINNKDKNNIDRALLSIDNEIKRRKNKKNNNHLIIAIDEEDEILTNKLLDYRKDDLNIHLILTSNVIDKKLINLFTNRILFRVDSSIDSKKVINNTNGTKLKETGKFYVYNSIDDELTIGQICDRSKRYLPNNIYRKEFDQSIEFINNTGNTLRIIESKKCLESEIKDNLFYLIEDEILKLESNNNWLWNKPIASDIDYNNIELPDNKNNTIIANIGLYEDLYTKNNKVLNINLEQNTIIYSNSIKERELLLSTIIYSTMNKYSSNDINYYIVDYGNKTLKKYQNIPHIGDIVYPNNEDKLQGLYNLFKTEISRRKTLDINKLTKIIIIINNYNEYKASNSIKELYELLRNSEKYGIYFIIVNDSPSEMSTKIRELCKQVIPLHLKDEKDYKKIYPKDKIINIKKNIGRGLFKLDNTLYEFQTLSIKDSEIKESIKTINNSKNNRARKIPIFPRYLDYDYIRFEIEDLSNVPVGILKNELEIVKYDYSRDRFNIVTSKKMDNTKYFTNSLIDIFHKIKNSKVFIIDPLNTLNKKGITNYYSDNFEPLINRLDKYFNRIKSDTKGTPILIINSLKELLKSIDEEKLDNLFKTIKKVSHGVVIVIEEEKNIKELEKLSLYKKNYTHNRGIWIGKEINNQKVFTVSDTTLEKYSDIGYIISNNKAIPCKLINFYKKEDEYHEER